MTSGNCLCNICQRRNVSDSEVSSSTKVSTTLDITVLLQGYKNLQKKVQSVCQHPNHTTQQVEHSADAKRRCIEKVCPDCDYVWHADE